MNKQHKTKLIQIGLIFFIGFVFMLGKTYILPQALSPEQKSTLTPPIKPHSLPTSPYTQTITVQLSGAIKQPGLYKIDKNKRVIDLIKIAGGLMPGADLSKINLAGKLKDGKKVTIPRLKAHKDKNKAKSAPKVVNINTASQKELETLPGVGPAMAKRILAKRKVLGGFSGPEVLVEVKGIGPKSLARLRPYLRF